MLFINLFGAPGAGKSTTRAGVFRRLKLNGINVEEVPEVAKDFTWEKRHVALGCQPYVFAKQYRNMHRLFCQVDCIVTDSPVLLSSFYNEYLNLNEPASFHTYVLDKFWSMRPFLNVFLSRVKPYNPKGRNQSQIESDMIGAYMQGWLQRNDIPYLLLPGDEEASEIIAEQAMNHLSHHPVPEEELFRGLEHLLPPALRNKNL
jgi:CDP-glycerol glycerophosphotransferase (TagB/SpsB family)